MSSLLHVFFDRAVGRWPDALALDIPPGAGRPARTTLTYAALDRVAEAVRRRLPALAAPDQLVAILLPRDSPWLLAAQLGVLRAGGAFTCLDPAFPDGQVQALLADAAPAAIVVDDRGASRLGVLGGLPAVTVVVDDALPAPGEAGDRLGDSPGWLEPSSLAYAIYTSGTSGRPKGVLIEHASIANLVQADLDEFGLGPGDRVAQGSSAAYDSSLEETWLALAAGATLVVVDDQTVRLGPDLVAWLADEHITVFCPPPTLLRSTGCEDPEHALPELRLLYVGGEALPADVAARWSRGRTLVNGYGPTETTVTVVRERVRPGAAIAVGRPITGVAAWVLDEQGREVAEGVAGELCLGGVALARGYRGLPALTAERFQDHPQLGRIYRTGDRATRDADGRLFCHGRLDAQVKVRGYRIELEAIEARLASCPGVAQAAAAVQGEGAAQRLVAFVVPAASGSASAVDVAALGAELAHQLPAYMVPTRIGVLDTLPATVGGKLDRSSLPRLDEWPGGRPEHPHVGPRSPVEAIVTAAMQSALHRSAPLSVHDDFFADLGGDSLGAGMLVSRLREHADTAALTTRDVYEVRTAAALAARVHPVPADAATAVSSPPLASTARVLAATAVQTAWILGELAINSLLAYLAAARAVPWLEARVGLAGVVWLAPFVVGGAQALWTPLSVLVTAAVSRALVGRVRPGRAPAWGSLHVRLWIVGRVAARIPWDALAGTHAISAALRTLGAQVGHHVHVHRGVDLSHGCWHLLTLGDHVSLARDVALRVVDLDDGHVVVGPVSVGDGATLDVHAGVGPGSHIGAGACLGPWSSVGGGTRVPDGERWAGVPAARTGRTPPAPIAASPRRLGAWTHAAAIGAARAAADAAFWLPAIVAAQGVLAVAGLHSLGDFGGRLRSPALWLLVAGAAVAALTTSLGLSAVLCRLLGPERHGVTAARSWTSVRVELKTRLLDRASTWLSGSLFWPLWLRAAGMRIGRRCEVSTIVDTVPDLVAIADECFLADGVYLAAPRVDRGTLTMAPVGIGARTFVGNYAVLGPGAVLPADALLGVCTVATPAMAGAAGAAWFGHPPMPLPRPRPSTDRRTTHAPALVRRVNRWLWETARLGLPVGLLLVGAWWLERMLAISPGSSKELPYDLSIHVGQSFSSALSASGLALIVQVSAVTAAAGAGLAAACLALKWLLLGRVRPGEHPLWSCWCSRWDFMYVAWSIYVPWFVAPLEGTLWLTWYLRAMGMTIGRRVLLGAGFAQVVDPDMITIGDGATVHALFQAHTFEDRLLKMGRVHIEAGATVGTGAVTLYGTVVGAGTRVAPHSVVMKGETLAAHTAYEGAPVAVVPRG